RALAIELRRLVKRAWVDDDRRVKAILVQPDPRQVLRDKLARREAAARHRVAHLWDGRFDDTEGSGRLTGCWWTGLAAEDDRGCPKEQYEDQTCAAHCSNSSISLKSQVSVSLRLET